MSTFAPDTPAAPHLTRNQLIDQICAKLGISVQHISNDYLSVLSEGDEERHIWGFKFDLNTAASALVADDKFATFDLLNAHQIPVVEHRLIYPDSNLASYAQNFRGSDYAQRIFEQFSNHVVIKRNHGSLGLGVVEAKTPAELRSALREVFRQDDSASICPFYDIKKEYRVIILDGEVQLAFAKEKQNDWRFNLHYGAKATQIPAEKYQNVIDLALKTAKIMNLRFCSVDIIDPTDEKLRALEVNSGVMALGYLAQHPEDEAKIFAMYERAIAKMFNLC